MCKRVRLQMTHDYCRRVAMYDNVHLQGRGGGGGGGGRMGRDRKQRMCGKIGKGIDDGE